MNFLTLYIFSALSFYATVPGNDTLPDFPKNYFRSPVDIPIYLTGNFGEPRKSHFHSGLDIKTKEKEGLNVYAVADGYVSRINVSPFGYGNALYITHPNGYTSVYAHLRSFNNVIQKYLRTQQYNDKRFSENILLPPNILTIRKGDVIAASGNTGGSGGPHLHFEIRDSLERIINPLHFGFVVQDSVKPIINGLEFFPLEDDLLTKQKRQLKEMMQDGMTYVVPPVKSNAKIVGIAINTYDKMTRTNNSYGVYSITAIDNNDTFFIYKADRFAFENSRNVISHLDYETFLTSGFHAFHKCYVEPHNSLGEYSRLVNNGKINLSDGRLHKIKITVSDFAGNKNYSAFEIQYSDTSKFFANNNAPYTLLLHKDSLTEYKTDELTLSIPAKALVNYTRLNIESKRDTSSKILSLVVTLNKNTEHLLSYYTISLKTNVNRDLQDKAVIVWRNEKCTETSKGGDFENGFITTKVREFGTFYVKADTTKPVVRPLSFSTTKAMGALKKWTFLIKDELSGIETYNAYIDGKWTLAEYDAKFNALHILNETKLSAGKHSLRIEVQDERQNTTIYETNFIY